MGGCLFEENLFTISLWLLPSWVLCYADNISLPLSSNSINPVALYRLLCYFWQGKYEDIANNELEGYTNY